MSKSKITLISIAAVILIIVLSSISAYNGFISKEEAVKKAWGNVETNYQRRSDLIPNLVNTVKGYATHEKSTLQEVTNARAQATQITVDANNLTEENIRKYQQAQGAITSALSRLIAISENYPELKASENFSELQAQLEGTENRINEARKIYNEAVQTYNVSVRRFPANIIASMFGFETKTEFKAEAGAEKAPEVNF